MSQRPRKRCLSTSTWVSGEPNGDHLIHWSVNMYSLHYPLRREILLSISDMYHPPGVDIAETVATQLVTGTSQQKQNKASRQRGGRTVYASCMIPTEDGPLKKVLLVGDDVGRHGGGEGLDTLNDGRSASARRNHGG